MELIVLSFLILLNGFFALSEIALVSAKKTRLEQKKNEGSKGAAIAISLLSKSESFLSAIQVGITLIGIVTGVYGGINIADDIAPWFQQFDFTAPVAKEVALTITVVTITYVSIVVGELVPKTIALNNPEKIAIRVAPVILFFSRAFYPFVRLLSGSTFLVCKILGIKKVTEHISETELRQMLKLASTSGVIEREQNFMHEKVFHFADKKARHIMTHRTEVEWIDVNRPAEEINESLLNARHSKIVCCRDDPENFVGIIYLREFYKSLSKAGNFNINDIITEPLIVPESADAQKVLDLLRVNKKHICCVVNEYGGFEGIITIHDIIEHILGQVPDERDPFDPD
ncbi:MAG TPA: hemolysin family protein, partial [Bacteroidales bacterium]|nr:hemolysin family protein [Bacteroidales bacterium]